MDFDNLVWQDAIKTVLLNSLKTKNISHAYIFSWSRWTGKTTCARLIAKALNCLNLNQDWTPCNKCDNCTWISNWSFVDLVEIDAASHTWVDNIRELQSKIWFSPTLWIKKVYVLDEVHMLSKSSFNALLKTIEEPPSFVHFILVTTELHQLLETIVSRCIVLNFKKITSDAIQDRLKYICLQEQIPFDSQAIALIAHQSNGWMRDAISILDKLRSEWWITESEVITNLWLTWAVIVNKFLESVFRSDQLASLNILNELATKWYDIISFNDEVIEQLRSKMLKDIRLWSNVEPLIKIIEIFIQSKTLYSKSVIPILPLEIATIEAINLLWWPAKVVQISEKKPEVSQDQDINLMAEQLFDF